MKRHVIIVNGTRIPYVVRRSTRTRRLRITVHGDARVVITAPSYVGMPFIKQQIEARAGWLWNSLRRFAERQTAAFMRYSRRDYLRFKEQARTVITARVVYFADLHHFSYGRISIRDQRTMWGSCSAQGNLNFSYKLLFLPPAVRDYVIVHELCHLKTFNHSPAFWGRVSEILPSYKIAKKMLRDISSGKALPR